jgi:competence protein ComEA
VAGEPVVDRPAGGAGEGLRRWLPAGLRGARLVAPRQAVAGLVAVALLSAVVTALALWWVRPRPAEVGPPPLVAGSADPGVATAAATPTARPLVVSVVGKVRKPGLVTVPAGSRLVDAVRAAGGPMPGVDLTALNLARKVTDGEQIVVGGPAPAEAPAGTAGAPAAGATTVVNLNSATLAELDSLPGVGPVIAQRILDWRAAHGGFTSVDQLRDVSGIGDRTFEHLRDLVTV